MKYALNMDRDGRILSATYDQYAPSDYPRIDELPEGDIGNYLYISGEYVYTPLPQTEQPQTVPAQEERITALEKENRQIKEALDLLLSGKTEEEVSADG